MSDDDVIKNSASDFLDAVIVRAAVLPMRTPGVAWDEQDAVKWAIGEEYGKDGEFPGWKLYMLHYTDNDDVSKGILLAWRLDGEHKLSELLLKLKVGPKIVASKEEDADGGEFFVIRWQRVVE